jgi:hypothetical protein
MSEGNIDGGKYSCDEAIAAIQQLWILILHSISSCHKLDILRNVGNPRWFIGV